MSTPIVLLLVVMFLSLVSLAVFVWLERKGRDESSRQLQEMARQIIEAQKQDQSIQFLQREITGLRDRLSESMQASAKMMMESQKTVGERLDKAAEVFGNVQRSLGSLDNATKQVYMVGKDIAQLQEILRAPKLRGAFGELFLGDLLKQILPQQHALQHKFKSGQIVDAVVRLGKLVPVDAKFPLENFKRMISAPEGPEKNTLRRAFEKDVKRHIDAISSKYILPDEGTYDFALMYIPAENVYYETIIKEEGMADEQSIMTYAFSKQVVPVSPNSFFAYLNTIALGLRGLQIEENARHIIDQLSRLRGDFGRFKEDFLLVGKHLGSARSKFEDSERRLGRFEDKLISTGGDKKDEVLISAEVVIPSLPLQDLP